MEIVKNPVFTQKSVRINPIVWITPVRITPTPLYSKKVLIRKFSKENWKYKPSPINFFTFSDYGKSKKAKPMGKPLQPKWNKPHSAKDKSWRNPKRQKVINCVHLCIVSRVSITYFDKKKRCKLFLFLSPLFSLSLSFTLYL